MKPWEIHPTLVHFPIAFLLAAVALDLVALKRPKESMTRAASGLMVAGVVTAIPTIAAGILAWFTVPHSEEIHSLMYWHPSLAIAAILIFGYTSVVRWRARAQPCRPHEAVLSVFAAVLLSIAGYLGGYMVYHGGAGVETRSEVETDQQDNRPPSAEDVLKERQKR